MSTPYAAVPAGGNNFSSAQAKGFLSALFDLSFTSFITTKIIKLLFIISIIGAGFCALGVIIAGFNVNSMVGILALVLSPVAFLLVVAYARITLELIMVFFRIEEHGAETVRLASGRMM